MDKIEFRAVMKHFWMAGKTAAEIRNILLEVHGVSTPSFSTISEVSEFKRDRTSTSDEPRSGRPKTATNDEIVDKIHDVVLADHRLKLKEIAEVTGISEERVGYILHEIFGIKKLWGRWIPRLLIPEQKRNRVTISEECLARIQRNPRDFFIRFVAVDEIWIHHYIPETKEQWKQWTFQGESAPKEAKSVPSTEKVMATIFWDSQGMILIDYLQEGRTNTGQYYSDLLSRFDAVLKEKRPRLQRKELLFHHNVPAHSSRIVVSKLNELRYELVYHPPYSRDLARSDFLLFPDLRRSLAGKRFASKEKVVAATNDYFADLETSFFVRRLKKCIDLRGDYIEK